MKLAAYVRVSTEKQRDEGCGLDVQRDAVCSWATAHGHTLASWYTDALSGSLDYSEREGLADALDAVRRCAVEGIVIYRLDRLARSLVTQELLLAQVERWGGRVFSTVAQEDALLTGDDDDPDAGTRRLIRQILGSVAEYERALIKLRLMAGQRRKRASGGYAGGARPYGWQLHNGIVSEDPAEQSVRAQILALRQGGASLRVIADLLERTGVPGPKGGKWHANTIKRIAEYEPPVYA